MSEDQRTFCDARYSDTPGDLRCDKRPEHDPPHREAGVAEWLEPRGEVRWMDGKP